VRTRPAGYARTRWQRQRPYSGAAPAIFGSSEVRRAPGGEEDEAEAVVHAVGVEMARRAGNTAV